MKRALVCILCIFAPLATTPAQTALFVSSAPIEAEVTVNGTARGATPLLLRDLEPGTYEVTVVKPGHVPATERVELGENETRAVELRPEPSAFVGAFSADETIVGERSYSRQQAVLELPAGTYELSSRGRTLSLQPVYPNEGALSAARIVTIAGGAAAALATIEDVLVTDARSYFTSYMPSPGTIAVWGITVAAGGFWIALEAEKADYVARMEIRAYEGDLTAAEAERVYRSADEFLEAGNLSRALDDYTTIVANGGDSEYVPDALYKAAEIYSVSGDLVLSSQLLELLISDYPAPDVYDRALKSLSDAYVARGRYDDAIARLEMMLFYDPTYSRDDIADEIGEIEELREGDRR
ncbi:MAG: PEGA domain-containing protein [Spirochaetota bacterium]